MTAAIVNGEEIAAWSYIDPALYSHRVDKIPGNLRFLDSMEELLETRRDAALLVTPFILPEDLELALRPVAVLRPKVLVVGIGCNRGTSAREIREPRDEDAYGKWSLDAFRAEPGDDLRQERRGWTD